MSGGRGTMVGRERELEVLRRAAALAESGDPQTVLVIGEAGVGKTRLARELTDSLDPARWLCLASHGVPLADGEVPFGGAAELVRGAVRALGAAEVRRLAGRAAPLLGLLVPSVADPPDHGVDRAEVTGAVLALLEALARPVCWLLDDVPWLDRATGDLVLYVDRVVAGPVLLLGTARTPPEALADLPADLAELGRRATVVPLGPLSREQVAAQVATLTDDRLPDDSVERIAQLSEGLPFYVEQLVREGGRVAGSLGAVLQARLEQVSAPARQLLAAAAVGEGLLVPQYLRDVSALGDDLAPALAEVRSRGLLVTSSGGEVLRFHHALLRDAVDAGLLAEERLAWHRAWAAYLDGEAAAHPHDLRLVMERARHHDAVGGPAAFGAVLAAARAAELAQDVHARRHWWERVLARWTPDHADEIARDRVLNRFVTAMWAVGWVDELDALLAEEMAGEPDWLRSLWLRLELRRVRRAVQLEFTPAVPAAEADDVLARLAAHPQDFLTVVVSVRLADEWLSDLPEVAERMLRQVVPDPPVDVEPGVQVDAWELLAWLESCRGDPDERVAVHMRHVAWVREHDPGALLEARCRLVVGLLDAGRFDECAALLEQNLAEIRDPHLHPHHWVTQHMLRAVLHLQTGHWERIPADLERARDGAFGGDLESWWNMVAGMRAARMGDLATVRACLDDIPEPPPGTTLVLGWSQEALQRARLELEIATAEGDPQAVRRAAARAAGLCHPGDPPDDPCEVRLLGVRGGVGRADADADAQEFAAEAAAFAAAAPRWPSGYLRECLAEIELHVQRAAGVDSAPTWHDLAARWTALGRPFEAAHCRLFEGECALHDGDRETVARALTAAHATAVGLGARPLQRRVEAVARAARIDGVGRARAAHGLTVRETEVLQLLVRGRSNPEIARTLSMSVKTVSVHVSHVIAKLGVANRTEAATAAVREGLLGEPAGPGEVAG